MNTEYFHSVDFGIRDAGDKRRWTQRRRFQSTAHLAAYLPAALALCIGICMSGCSQTGILAAAQRDSETESSVTISTESETADSDLLGGQGDGDTDADTDADSDTDADADSDADSDTDTDVDTDVDTDTDTDTDVDTDTDADTDSASMTDADSDPVSDADAGMDTSADTDSGTIPMCNCLTYEVCDEATGMCNCPVGYTGEFCTACDETLGYIEWPVDSNTCIPDPCSRVTCGNVGECTVSENGQALCRCTNGYTGIHCNQRWTAMKLPPFVLDAAFDSDGNGWFATTLGLLYWDFNGTEDTADDRQQLYTVLAPDEEDINAHDTEYLYINSVSVDSRNRKWIGTTYNLYCLEDNRTPMDLSDDAWTVSTWGNLPTGILPENFYGYQRFKLDGRDRLWVFPNPMVTPSFGVYMLSDLDRLYDEDVPWVKLAPSDVVTDVVSTQNGVWLAAETMLQYVSMSGTPEDTADDVWTDFSGIAALGGRPVRSIERDDENNVTWFNTDRGIVKLADGGDPLDDTTNIWQQWSSDTTGTSPAGPVLAVERNGIWLNPPGPEVLHVTVNEIGDAATVVVDPAQSAAFENIDPDISVSRIAVDDNGDKLITASGMLINFDDADTPADSSDDVWSLLNHQFLRKEISSFLTHPAGGFWISTLAYPTPIHNGSCVTYLYHMNPGAVTDPFDDEWTKYNSPYEQVGNCFGLMGVDSRENLWLRYSWSFPWGSGSEYTLFYEGKTLQDEVDDAWVTYPSETFDDQPPVIDAAFGLWFGAYLWDYGAEVSDTDDDEELFVNGGSPTTVALDGKGARWFGYMGNTESFGVIGYLDNAGTPADTNDDIAVPFTLVDGAPFTNIRVVQIDRSNKKWFLGNGYEEPQLGSLDDNGTPMDKSDDTWTWYSTADGMSGENVYTIAPEPAGGLWIGTDGGMDYLVEVGGN